MTSDPRPEILVRDETPADYAAAEAVNRAAFGQVAEAELVARLRGRTEPLISLVAVVGDAVVGHVMFSPVRIHERGHDQRVREALGLGPVAVVPAHQRTGIGSALIREGLERCAAIDASLVVVLGHPEYYPRFGFVTAFPHGLWFGDEPKLQPAFMVLELRAGALEEVSGEVRYRPEFDGV